MFRRRAKVLAIAALLVSACLTILLAVVVGPVVGAAAVVILGIAIAVAFQVEVRKYAEPLVDAMMAVGITIISILFAVAAVSVRDFTLGVLAGLIAVLAAAYALWRLNRVIRSRDTSEPPLTHS